MRRVAPLSYYTRAALRSQKPDPTRDGLTQEELGKSILAWLAAGEYFMISTFVKESNCGDPWEEKAA